MHIAEIVECSVSIDTIFSIKGSMMLKKLFDWTPRDIAYWERIRRKGLAKFIAWYGVVISGGLLFLVFGLVTFFIWLRQTSGGLITSMSLIFLLGQLIIVLLVCLLGGIINSLLTWVVEERLYRKYKAQS
jgi:hypothetical protein